MEDIVSEVKKDVNAADYKEIDLKDSFKVIACCDK